MKEVLIGVLSWLIESLLALLPGRLLSDQVSLAFLQTPLSYVFSLSGVGLWLVLVVVLATLASILPARAASRLTMRDVLAYEQEIIRSRALCLPRSHPVPSVRMVARETGAARGAAPTSLRTPAR